MPQLSPHAPQKVRDDFDEAQRCLSVNANTAASMMLRRALEQICLDHGVDDGVSFGLAGKLKSLEKQGIITGDLGMWASSIKEIGDDGAHSRDVSRTDAQEAARFLEAVADYLYTYRKQYEEFTARRKS
jgi:hypothetical protein